MSKKSIKIEVTYQFDVEINSDNSIVKEYDSEDQLIQDLISYRFSSILPVIGKGVIVKDIEVLNYKY